MLHANQARIRSFRVVPSLPEPLAPLLEIAHNLWWTWHPEAASLFRRLDRELWRSTDHNPVKMLGTIRQDLLEKAAQDQSYLHALGHAIAKLRNHNTRAAWYHQEHAAIASEDQSGRPLSIAYFSAEFGLTECLQIYSGGLGCLAGDHLKSASELGLPLVGVGLLYRCGYFHQYLNADGWQQETFPEIDFPNQPVHRVIDPETGEQYRVQVELPDRIVTIGVWRCNVGRAPLYLLDTNFPENSTEDRDITRNLYGGDVETRIKQEIVLGIGGMRALAKMGITPSVYHMNEGHSAFLALEHIRMLRQKHNATFEETLEAAAAQHIFTTHTPVPAGIDRFSPELIRRYLGWMPEPLGLSMDGLLTLGREHEQSHDEFFSMAVLAIRTSKFCNGVSKLHGKVSRNMWRSLWPGLPEEEAPIGHVTNGVHARSWLSPELMTLFDRYIGSAWLMDPTDHSVWSGVFEIPDDELWRVHEKQREKTVTWCRRKIRHQLTMRGAGSEEIEEAASALDPDIFTIGFARRFATYKRANLLLRDKKRLKALLENDERPVQFLIAGKAHPADSAGKELIRELVNFSQQHGRCHRVVFLEDYDISIGRRLVRGCDVWLNTPRRGLEASGTSGMKAAMNGVINVSILDGWWDEAHENEIGFAIGRGEAYNDADTQDDVECRALYDLLERKILPEFYDRDASGTPHKWVARMKRCIWAITPFFNTNRMVAEYAEKYYFPCHEAGGRLSEADLSHAREVAAQLTRYHKHWHGVHIEHMETPVGPSTPIHTAVPVTATVNLGELRPDEVAVQIYYGAVTGLGDMVEADAVDMRHDRDMGAGRHLYVGEFPVDRSGRAGFSVRVMPRDPRAVHSYIPGLITWHHDATQPGAPSGHGDHKRHRERVGAGKP
ncbi:MAG: glycosyltransferase family 1 protein [Phycisphaeraceae bacterium]|nr:MAG: glycosyltransferase family 1 protein [Phycisphaeraceae bacterium]